MFETAGNQDVVQDITDSTSYSIQEVKIKSERDRELEDAEKRKTVCLHFLFLEYEKLYPGFKKRISSGSE